MARINLADDTLEFHPMIAVLARNWWAIAMRGVLGILFGLVALFLPGATMLSLVLVFAAYTFVDGVFAITSAVRAASEHERWGLLVLEGIADIVVAGIAIFWPGITVVAFVLLVAFWALVTGGLMLWAAFRLDMEFRPWVACSRWHRIVGLRCAADRSAIDRGAGAHLVARCLRIGVRRRSAGSGLQATGPVAARRGLAALGIDPATDRYGGAGNWHCIWQIDLFDAVEQVLTAHRSLPVVTACKP